MKTSAEILAHRESQILSQATSLVFKEIDGGPHLRAHLFLPQEDAGEPGARRPAALFFYSAGWNTGSPTHFAPQAMHLAERGVVSILIELRQHSTHGTGPAEAVADACSAFRWVRHHADRLAVDPGKVAGIAAYSAGLVLLAAAMSPSLVPEESDPPGTSGAPNLLALFNPVVEVDKTITGYPLFHGREIRSLSPMNHIRKGLPPMLFFHGTADRLASFAATEKFVSKMRWKRNDCSLIPFQGRDQGFYAFNFDPEAYEGTLYELDQFMVGQGYLPPAREGESARLISVM